MAPAAGGHIEDFALGKAMKLLHEKLGGWRICAEDLLRQSCALNADSDGTGYVGDRGVQLPQPELDTIDREFMEQRCQEPFRQSL